MASFPELMSMNSPLGPAHRRASSWMGVGFISGTVLSISGWVICRLSETSIVSFFLLPVSIKYPGYGLVYNPLNHRKLAMLCIFITKMSGGL